MNNHHHQVKKNNIDNGLGKMSINIIIKIFNNTIIIDLINLY